MHPVLEWLRTSALGEAMRNSAGLFPTCESLHFVGLSLLLGAMLVVDLRILGAFREATYQSVLKLVPLAVIGFAVNLVTGVCLIAANPSLYFTNPAFQLKLVLIGIAGANALWFTLAEQRMIAALPRDAAAPPMARVLAAASLTIWIMVLGLGRMLPTFATVGGG